METTEVLYVKHECDKFIFNAYHIHDDKGQFTGITKIERRGVIGTSHTTLYAFYGCVYKTLDEALKEFKRIGRQIPRTGRRKR